MMKVAVAGLWHLGSVTAACLASVGHDVFGFDQDRDTIDKLNSGQMPVEEPGLSELIREQLAKGRLRFSSDPAELSQAKVVWIAYDTPVDNADNADVDFVVGAVQSLFEHLGSKTLVLISSQLPAGSTARLEQLYRQDFPDGTLRFGYSPENLRLGQAIDRFMNPDRVVVGTRTLPDRQLIEELLAPVTDRIEWMSVESAEMTKHAINAFLATSVVFINELTVLCEKVGADAIEVERGLKSDVRIGPKAYLRAGGAFAGGTLARDVSFLIEQANTHTLPCRLFPAVKESNTLHKSWACRRLSDLFDSLTERNICVLGLTYKPGTNTLRRSNSVETCHWLSDQGMIVRAHDPSINELPAELSRIISLCSTAQEAIQGSDAILLATPWPAFRELSAEQIVRWAKSPVVLDAEGFLSEELGSDGRIRYLTVGRAA